MEPPPPPLRASSPCCSLAPRLISAPLSSRDKVFLSPREGARSHLGPPEHRRLTVTTPPQEHQGISSWAANRGPTPACDNNPRACFPSANPQPRQGSLHPTVPSTLRFCFWDRTLFWSSPHISPPSEIRIWALPLSPFHTLSSTHQDSSLLPGLFTLPSPHPQPSLERDFRFRMFGLAQWPQMCKSVRAFLCPRPMSD